MLQRFIRLSRDESIAVLIRDTIIYTASKAIPGIIGLLSIVVFVRLLGPEQFGLFSILSSIAIMWSTFSIGWLNQGILRYYSGATALDNGRRQNLFLGLATAIICCSLALVTNLNTGGTSYKWQYGILCWLLAIFVILQSVSISLWQSKLQPKMVLKIELVRTIIGFALALGLIWLTGPSPAALLAGIAAGYAISLKFPTFARSESAFKATNFTVGIRELWNYGWPLSLWLGIQTAYPWFDRVSVEYHLGLAQTGLLASLSDVVTRSYSLAIFPLTIAVHPRVTSLWNQNGQREAYRLLRFATAGALAIGAMLVISFYFGRTLLVSWLLPRVALGQEGSGLVIWLAFSGLIWQLALLAHKPLELRGQTKTMLFCMVVSLAFKVAINLSTIPHWGLVGAVWGSLASGLVYCVGCIACIRLTGVPARSDHG